MVLQWYLLEDSDDPGTGAETDSRDLPREVTSKALILQIEAIANGTGGTSRVNLAAQLDQLRIGAVESNRVSEIDGEDLDAWNVLNGNNAFYHNSNTDNQIIALGMTYNLDPYCMGPKADFNQNFGMSPSVARKVEFLYAADGAADTLNVAVDNKQLSIGIIAKDREQPGTGGYLCFSRDARSTTNNVNTYQSIPQPGQLLAVLGFETNDTAAAQTAIRTANDITEMAVTVGKKDLLGPVYPDTLKSFNGTYETGALSDEGYFMWNLGVANEIGALGRGPIPDQTEIRVKGGSDAGAIRVYAARLNTNV